MRPRSALIWTLFGLACGVAGQWHFSVRAPQLAWGSALYALGILALVAAWRSADPSLPLDAGAAEATRDRVGPPWWRTVAGLLVAVGCTAGVLYLLIRRDRPHYWWAVVLWLAATASYFVAVLPRLRPRRAPALGSSLVAAGASPARSFEWLAPLLIVTIAFALRAYRLGDIPPTFGGDEANQALDAVYVLDGRFLNPFGLGWSSVPAMAGFVFSLGVALFGETMIGPRAVAVVAGTLGLIATYFLVRRLQGPTMAWITAALLATWAYHIHFSRVAGAQIFDTLFMSVALLFLVRAIQDGRRLDWAWSGVVVGLAQYAYAGARLTPIVVGGVCIAIVVLGGRASLRRHGVGMLVLLGAALVVAAPMIQVAVRYPLDYNARVGTVGIFQSGWIDQEVAYSGTTKTAILIDQVRRSVLGWNAYIDRGSWYNPLGHMLQFVPSVFFLLGLGYATLLPLDRRRIPMLFWWWGGTLIGGVLTVGPPQSQRLVTTAVPICFLAALAIERSVAAVERSFPSIRRIKAAVLVAAVVAIGAASVRFYFFDYTPSLLYGGTNSRAVTRLSQYASRLPGEGWTVVFLSAPRIYGGMTTLTYLAPEVKSMDILEPLTEPPAPSTFPADQHLCFVFLPERLGELELVRQTFPEGELYAEPPALPGEVSIFTAYTVRRAPKDAVVGR